MTEEHKIQNEIRLALADSCVIFRVKVAHKEYNGRTYENIKSISATLFPNVKPSVSVGEQVFEEILSDGDVPF